MLPAAFALTVVVVPRRRPRPAHRSDMALCDGGWNAERPEALADGAGIAKADAGKATQNEEAPEGAGPGGLFYTRDNVGATLP